MQPCPSSRRFITTLGGIAILALLSVSATSHAQVRPGVGIDRSIGESQREKLREIAACPEGHGRIFAGTRFVCVRPVVAMSAEEQALAPQCGAAQVLVRSDKGDFLCIDSTALPGAAEPVCFNGVSALKMSDGRFACRRRVEVDSRLPDLTISVLGAPGFTNELGSPEPFGGHPQAGALDVRIRNVGDKSSPETRVIFGFPSDAPFGRLFRFTDGADTCGPRRVPAGSATNACVPVHPSFAMPTNLNLNASCAVPPLEPGDVFTCYAVFVRTQPLAQFPRTDLVDRTRVFARVNDPRRFEEGRFDNNETFGLISLKYHPQRIDGIIVEDDDPGLERR
jgi:hypothetical protein